MKRVSAIMVRLKIAIIFLCLFCAVQAYGQVSDSAAVAAKSVSQSSGAQMTITGKVTDEQGEPLPGATIVMKGNVQVNSVTNDVGNFQITLPKGAVVVVSFVGMVTKEIKVDKQKHLQIVLSDDVAQLKGVEVVGNGMFMRRSETFTGSAATFTGEQLRLNGSVNALQSLKNLDPSFVINESVDMGSNPNTMPDVQFRGQSSIDLKGDYETSPNLPLFILNGFETSLEKIVDMDMNLIQSITILKDAAAKAIYGSKAANGVVVVETVQPKQGKLRVSYNGSLELTIPDLNSYHLTDAEGKLQAELLAGKYTNASNAHSQAELTAQYNEIYKEVARGVDSYWMSQPLRTGVGQRHSLMFDGGDSAMLYSASLSYINNVGVMKGSNRRTISGNLTLSYRVKNLIFRNLLTIDDNKGKESPYGSFSQYSRMNPYWRIHDNDGQLVERYSNGTWNPLYDAGLKSKNESVYTLITENFYTEWNLFENLKLTGRVGLTIRKDKSDVFTPASNSQYASILPSSEEYLNRGSYAQGHGQSNQINADLGLNYSITKGRHMLFTNLQYSVEQTKSETESFYAIGFPSDRMDFISFGNGYAVGGKPGGSESTTRSIGIIGAANYSYADRYLADFSYRLNASSMFGSKNKWGSFWSAGIGWNLHHEAWLKGNKILNYLKVRASIGRTGSQNFNSYQALSTYSYITDRTYNGDMGVVLMALANPNLKWQRQLERTVGFDITLFNRLSGRFEYYNNLTDNLLTDVTLAPSSGFSSFKENLGETVNKGYELTLNYRLLTLPQSRTTVNLFFNVAHNTNKISKISNALKAYNEAQDAAKDEYAGTEEGKAEQRKVSTRYEEGQSMTAIWAVRSAGIDPTTGQEVFIKKDGTTTFEWSSTDQVVCGDSQPKYQGNFGLSARWRNFDANCSFSYKWGGQTYNSTLVDKVENVDVLNWNVDERVLTERWNTPGQVAKFKSIMDTSTTKPTSRFVEDYNELAFSVITIGYDFSSLPIIKKSPLEYLKLTATMNDVGWLSTVKKEWGLSYPRARTFSFTLSARF
ncbi:MAG: SusC/RagA family TonB-linked outer membrane protein [Prevotella sp.]|nr:SusC/RagA family TonB-linked outer membrane protein [Prevotella sp.]